MYKKTKNELKSMIPSVKKSVNMLTVIMARNTIDIVAYFNNKYPELYISRPTVSKIIKDSAKRLLYNLE